MNDAAKRGQVGTPGALAERDAQVFRAGVHLNRLNSEFEDFLFGRIDLLRGKDGETRPGRRVHLRRARRRRRTRRTTPPTSPRPSTSAGSASSTPTTRRWSSTGGRRPPRRSTARRPKDPGRVVRRRVIRSKGRRVLGVEDDLMRPELTARLDGDELPVIGDGALMAALGQARSHTMRDIVSSIQAEQDLVIRAPAASVTEVAGGPGTGKTAVALHRAAYLLYQDRRRYSGGILVVCPDPAAGRVHRGRAALARRGGPGRDPRGRLARPTRRGGEGATTYDEPAVARIKGSSRMLQVLRKAARGALEQPAPGRPPGRAAGVRRGPPRPAPPPGCGWSPSARRVELEADELRRIRHNVARRHRAGQPAAPARPQAAAGRPVEQVRRAAAATPTPSWSPSCAPRFDEDVVHRDAVPRLPGRLVAGAHPAPGAGRDGRRAAARPLGAPDPEPGRGAPAGPFAEAAGRGRQGPALRPRRGAAGRAADACWARRPARSGSARRTRWTSSRVWRS